MRNRTACTAARLLLSALLFCLLATAVPASPPGTPYHLEIAGDVPHPVTLDSADLTRLPHYPIDVKNHDGTTARYECVLLIDVLRLTGMAFGDSVHGPRLATYFVAAGADNYRAIFTIADFDPAFSDRKIFVAFLRDGKPLAATEGPLRLVVPDDKRQARYVRQLVALTVVQLK